MRALGRRPRPDLTRALEQGLTLEQMMQLKDVPRAVTGQLSSVRYLGPLRSHPERLYSVPGVGSYASGMRGEFVAQRLYYQPGLVHVVNEWFEQFDIPYVLGVERVGDMAVSGEHIALVLEGRSGRTRVTLADVGFGVNQLLPIVVEGVDWFTGGEDRVLCVEQPEIHLHPRLQARLADLMIGTIGGRSKKQWIVIRREMGLTNPLQSVRSALGTKLFQREAGVELLAPIDPRAGADTYCRFRIRPLPSK